MKQKKVSLSYDSVTGTCSVRPTDVASYCLHPVRFNVPNAESYAKKVQMTVLDLEMPGLDEEKRQLGEKQAGHVWRGLRMASKQQLSSFDHIKHVKGLEALQPVTGVDAAPTGSDDQGSVPQDQQQSVEEQRPDQHGQVTADPAA
jgi:THO complex subunit 1